MNAWVDVLVVGAGPAGAQAARRLAGEGCSVVLVEAAPNPFHNAFSSAGTLIELLQAYELPESLVGSSWNGLEIVTTQNRGQWDFPKRRGVVLDFGRLRAFLCEEAESKGAQILWNTRYLSHREISDGVAVKLGQADGVLELQARLVLDASGFRRAVLGLQRDLPCLSATGLEYLVEVPSEIYDRYRERLVFFLGTHWAPQGYAWIFPMEAPRLKIGAGRLLQKGKSPGLKACIQRILEEEVGLTSPRILDVHGSNLRYTLGLKDIYYRGRVVGLGDVVSTVNILGGEGIRFAFEGVNILLPFILDHLRDPSKDFRGYRKAMHHRFKSSWGQCESLALRKYRMQGDAHFESLLRQLKSQEAEVLVDLLFHYRFGRFLRSAGPRAILKFLGRYLANRWGWC